MKRFLVCLILFTFASQWIFAQELLIKSVTIQPKDKSASLNPCLDQNGDTCALVKVVTDNLIGLEFRGTIKTVFNDGTYDVYMPSNSKKLSYGHHEYLSGQIDFKDYGFSRLRGGKTYIVKIETPTSEGKVVLRVQPSTASVIFDGRTTVFQKSGIYEYQVSPGTYKYSVEAPNFISFHGRIQIKESEVKTLPLSLKPIVHPVKIKCNVDDASVYIDGIDYGKIGLKKIPQGIHSIRISREQYLDWEEEVNVNSSVTSLSCFLKKNEKKVKEIHAIPITIIANTKKLYKNNKAIKEWTNGGSVIMFMPGKYFITKDNGTGKEIEVIDTPFTIHL